jgi:hypothetical protein
LPRHASQGRFPTDGSKVRKTIKPKRDVRKLKKLLTTLDTYDTNEAMATINLRDVPDELHNQFKAACALQGKSIREVLIDLMKREVEKGRPKK